MPSSLQRDVVLHFLLILYSTTHIENWGSGVKRIMEACQKRGVAAPTWSINGGFVVVTFMNPAKGDTHSDTQSDTQDDTQDGTQDVTHDVTHELLMMLLKMLLKVLLKVLLKMSLKMSLKVSLKIKNLMIG